MSSVTAEFHPIPGCDGYFVTHTGDVMSRRWGRVFPMRQHTTKQGYRQIQLRVAGRCRNFLVHSLVAAAFIGPRPARADVNHKDGVKNNNCVANLEYVTRSENVKHAFAMGLHVLAGIHNPQAKVDDEMVRAIRARKQAHAGAKKQYGLIARTARELGLSYSIVWGVWQGRGWSHVA